MSEQAVVFGSDRQLLGILHRPESCGSRTGVVVVVGGPQYRVGSHRQFVLLARRLSRQGVPVLRFDYSGMGDSGGPSIDFESASNDIAAAVQALFTYCPELRSAVLWGLCDGASASLIYAPTDQRVRGLVLLNPWVRSEAGLAQTHLKNYYGQRFKSAAFWRKMAREPASLFSSAAGYLSDFFAARGAVDASTGSFLERMLSAKGAFSGRTALLLSGNDLTAGEFKALLNRNSEWQSRFCTSQDSWDELDGANHTFSSRDWREWVECQTVDFVMSIDATY